MFRRLTWIGCCIVQGVTHAYRLVGLRAIQVIEGSGASYRRLNEMIIRAAPSQPHRVYIHVRITVMLSDYQLRSLRCLKVGAHSLSTALLLGGLKNSVGRGGTNDVGAGGQLGNYLTDL